MNTESMPYYSHDSDVRCLVCGAMADITPSRERFDTGRFSSVIAYCPNHIEVHLSANYGTTYEEKVESIKDTLRKIRKRILEENYGKNAKCD